MPASAAMWIGLLRPATGDGKWLGSWSLSAGGVATLKVNLCDGTSANPKIEIQVPPNTSASQSYGGAGGRPFFPNKLHVEVVAGTLVRGCVDV